MNACAMLALIAACSDDDAAGTSDAAIDAPVVAAPIEAPAAPEAPTLPRLTPCREGWRERTTALGVAWCDPFPDAVRRCEGATAARMGATECVHVGPPCPAGDWADDLPADRPIVYVRAGASVGDGTVARPFGTIARAIDAAEEGAVIAIGKGRYRESLVIERSLSLQGACADETEIAATDLNAIVVAAASVVDLRALTVSASEGWAVTARDDATVNVDGLRVDIAGSSAFYATGREMHVRDVVTRTVATGMSCVRGTCSLRDATIATPSIAVSNMGGSVTIERVVVLPARDRETASALALATASDTTIRGFAVIAPRATIGLSGRVTVEDLYLGEQAYVIIAGGETTLRRVYAAPRSAFDLQRAAVVAFEDVLLDDNGFGVFEETIPAIFVREATTRLDRVAFERGKGVFVQGSTLRGSDVTLRGVETPEGRGGFAVFANDAMIELERASIDTPRTSAVLALGASRVSLRDLRLHGSEGIFGVGAVGGASLTLERAAIESARTVAVFASGSTSRIEGSDVAIDDTLPATDAADFGRAIDAEGGATIELSRVRISRSRGHAVIALAGASLVLRDLAVESTRPLSCARTSCPDVSYGVGVGAYGAHVGLEGFSLRTAALCGLHIAAPGDVDLTRGLVAQTPIAVCLDDPGFDTARLTEGVMFVENGQNLAATSLPIPPAAPPVELPE